MCIRDSIEPALVDGRDPNVPLAAYYAHDGMAVDFGKVAQSMARDTLANRPDEAKILTGRKVVEVIREDTSGQLFRTLLDDGTIILSKAVVVNAGPYTCLLYTSPRPRDRTRSRMPSSA